MNTTEIFLGADFHASWRDGIKYALSQVDESYLDDLANSNWLPGMQNIFKAFELPLEETRYVLIGESPYPRVESATGFAFMDGAVGELWSETGLSKSVNRATSLRNFIKMLLVEKGELNIDDTSQSAIARVNKNDKVITLADVQANLLSAGVCLLNASLVFRGKDSVKKDAKYWQPFLASILEFLSNNDRTSLILMGKIANEVNKLAVASQFNIIELEHPYNISFINNTNAHAAFSQMRLLDRK